jgi:hypothetical protein
MVVGGIMAKGKSSKASADSSYSQYEQVVRAEMDNCARIVIRGIANFGAAFLLDPNSKLTAGTYPYEQYIHNGNMIVENGYLKYRIVMKISGTYKIEFGKKVSIKGDFAVSETGFSINSFSINGYVKLVKNDLVSDFDYVWEGKSLLKKYKYSNSDIIKIPRVPQPAPQQNYSNSSYR